MSYEEISRSRAKQLIDEADGGVLVTINTEPVPVIGDVDKYKFESTSTGYRFGDVTDQ